MKQIRKTIVLQTSTKRFPLALTQQQDTLLTLFSPTILEAGLHCDTVCLDQQRGISGLVAHRSSNFFQGTSTIQKFGRFSVNPLSRVSAAPQAATNGHVTIDIKEDEPNNGNGPGNDTERGSRDIHANSVNVASILRRDSAAVRKPQPKKPPPDLERYCLTGRVYHPEHFHGHRRFFGSLFGSPEPSLASPSVQDGRLANEAVQASMPLETANLEPSGLLQHVESQRPKGDEERGIVTGAPLGHTQSFCQHPPIPLPDVLPQHHPPMPKWPANWQSAAFEAVSQKRSYILSPPETYAELAHHGWEKSRFCWYKLLMLSLLAGAYVGLGYTTALQAAGLMDQAPSNPDRSSVNRGVFNLVMGAFGSPFVFTMIVICGAELFSSMCVYTAAAWWEGKISIVNALRMLFMSYFGNFAGTAIMVGLLLAANTFDGKNAYLVYSAELKISDTWGATLVKGILANWLVGIATWMANAAQDLTGKFVGIWLPISAFAAIGFEHCIANMFLIPMAVAYGANVDARGFVAYNLIPATIGNWIGGAVFVATSYAFVYGRTPPRIYAYLEHKWHVHIPGARI